MSNKGNRKNINDLLTPKIEEFADLVTEHNAEHDLVDQAEYDAAVENVSS